MEGQYLPFILGYMGIPAVWVNSTDGDRVIKAAEDGFTATLELIAETEKNAFTESFSVIIPGENKAESIIVNTHTDGTNCIEENGPVALLSMLRYFKDKKPDRTLVFVFVTGHFRLPSFKDVNGGGVQATSKWLAAHKDLWDGKGGHLKAVACVSVEHLGCKRFKDTSGFYVQTGDVETELVYTGTKRSTPFILKRSRAERKSTRSPCADTISCTSARVSRRSTAEFPKSLSSPRPTA